MIKRGSFGNKGFLLVEALVSAVVIGIFAVAIYFAFGSGRDAGSVSGDYVVATALAQRQLEIIENSNINWNDGYVKFSPESGVDQYKDYIGISEEATILTFNTIQNGMTYSEQIKCQPEGNLIRCEARVWWTPSSVTGVKSGNAAKDYSITVVRMFPKNN